ncbi:MAG TPA: methyltransferase domain-containing protein [Chryseolinea sp.]
MKEMAGGFDRIAPFYDSLARFVFGDSIKRCQLEYLNKIPPGAKVLILGGGTGWILVEMMKANPTCTVWYVEASIKMVEIAKKRLIGLSHSDVFFINGTEKDLQQYNDICFDAVITNFYFDLFTPGSLNDVLVCIKKYIYPGSILLVCDFVDRAWWQRFLLFLMYRFFRWTCGIEAKNLPDWQLQLAKAGFVERSTTWYYRGFIKSALHVL